MQGIDHRASLDDPNAQAATRRLLTPTSPVEESRSSIRRDKRWRIAGWRTDTEQAGAALTR
jgi:hypothetical protein